MKEQEIRNKETFDQYLQLVAEDVEAFFSDKADFVYVVCPACSSKKNTFQFQKTGFSYTLCDECATLFVNPRPPFEKLMRFYANSKSTSFWVNDFFKPVAEARRVKIFRPRVEDLTRKFADKPLQVIGDIGAGFGLFLEELKVKWPDKRLIAIEPSEEMAEICRGKGLEVLPYMMEDVKGFDGAFDLLCSFELFEHLYDPEFFLKQISKLLKKGGYFLFTTLSGKGFDIQILWEQSKSVSPPHHLNFFNPASASKLLEKCGFKVVEAETPGKLDWDIVEGAITKDGFKVERLWEQIAGLSPEAKAEFQAWISKNKLSSHMRILAQKV